MRKLNSVSDALELLTDPFDGVPGEWDDVIMRAGVTAAPAPRRPLRMRVLAVTGALAVALGLAATPFGRAVVGATIERFSAWVGGEPGEPAAPEQQRAFERRNAASYASFPEGTQLRYLLSVDVAGRQFDLVGFRSRASLCLRLVRAWNPGIRSVECIPESYLGQITEPAAVAGAAYLPVGDPAQTIEGVYGFAADDVEAIEVERRRSGTVRVTPRNNVFASLRARRAGRVADHPLPDPVVRVRAVTRAGDRVLIPFVSGYGGQFGESGPQGPSYLGAASFQAEDVPGPTQIERRLDAYRVGWVERREARGGPLPAGPQGMFGGAIGKRLFGRTIQPDPDDPFRVGVSVVRGGGRSPGARRSGLQLCLHELRPLQPRSYSAACLLSLRPDPERGAILDGGYAGSQWTRLSGLVVDGVGSLELFLASGRRMPVALRDNAYAVQAAYAEFPAKLVAYDAEHRVVGLRTYPGPEQPKPCPAAEFRPGEPGPPRTYERLDLSDRTVGGHAILGRTESEVVAALGPPARRQIVSRSRGRRHSWEFPFLRYGSAGNDFALGIRFGVRGDRLVAVALTFQGPRVTDRRLGRVLRMQPQELERAIARTYGAGYRLRYGYGAMPEHGCAGLFEAQGIRREVGFGLDPRHPGRIWLSMAWW